MPMKVVVAAFFALVSFAAPARAVGFQHLFVPGPDHEILEVGIWYPSNAAPSPQPAGPFTQEVATDGVVEGKGLPLIVISHGSGGAYFAHYDTALALAQAGFVVAALTHPGDNNRDESKFIEAPVRRPREVSRLVDYMLTDWPEHDRVDPNRIGAFGFSSGGFTALVLVGGVPDMKREAEFCAQYPQDWPCRMASDHKSGASASSTPPLAWAHDDRIKAAVIAAPALGPTFTQTGLAGVHVPIQLWRGADDPVLRNPYFAQAIYDALATKPEYHVVPKAGHFSFIAPCPSELARVAPEVCRDESDFDRTRFHEEFDRAVVSFFRSHLGEP
jgi:predicted dienelactone hydrolase